MVMSRGAPTGFKAHPADLPAFTVVLYIIVGATVLFVIVLLSIVLLLYSPTTWERHRSNPV